MASPKRNYKKAAELELNRQLYEGDHWPSWVGPKPEADDKNQLLRRVFQSANIVRDCVDFMATCLIGDRFDWYLKDGNGERVEGEQIADLERLLQHWLDWVDQQAIERGTELSDPWIEFVINLLVDEQAALRIYQPIRYAFDDIEYRRLHLQALRRDVLTVERDDDNEFIEEVKFSLCGGGTETHKWIQPVDEDGNPNGPGQIHMDRDGVPIGEPVDRWFLAVVNGSELITESVRQLQNSINHGLTMKLMGQELFGFRERVYLNAQAPGTWEESPVPGQPDIFVPGDMTRRPGQDTYMAGIPTQSTRPDGSLAEGFTAPAVYDAEPIDPAALLKSIDADIALIYRQFKQGFRLASDDGANLSGSSRVQQRAEFQDYMRLWKGRIEGAIANMLNVVLELLGEDQYTAVVSLNSSTGKLTPEERQAIIAEYQAGLLSKASTMAALGSAKDVDAELALMDNEREEAMAARPVPDIDPPTPVIEPDEVDE
jgi:hypothetical protein